MNDRFKFRVALRTETHSIVAGCDRVSCPQYYIDLDDCRTIFENKYANDCFWEFLEEIKKQEHIQEIMQCTGLKDKNGKLIYEGDIVKTMGNREATGYGVVEYLQSGCRFYVNGYLDNPSPYHPRKKGELYHPLQEWLCKEVIGNIYENPELLEVKNVN